MLTYTVVLTSESDGGALNVKVPAMPGIFTWGRTKDEALASAREAIALHLESYAERGRPFPRDRKPRATGRPTSGLQIETIETPTPEEGASPAGHKMRETWRDWMAADAPEPTKLLTRDELIAQLRAEGVKVSYEDLRNWTRYGVLPFGVVRWHQGRKQTLFAPWVADAIHELRAQQAAGHTMAEIRATLRSTFHAPFVVHATTATAAAQAHAPTMQVVVSVPTATATAAGLAPTITVDDAAPALKPQLAQLARAVEATLGGRIVRTEIKLIDERGLPLIFTFDAHLEKA